MRLLLYVAVWNIAESVLGSVTCITFVGYLVACCSKTTHFF